MARWPGIFRRITKRVDRQRFDGRSTRRSRRRPLPDRVYTGFGNVSSRHVTVSTFTLECGHVVVRKPGQGGGFITRMRCPTCTKRNKR